MEELLKKFSDAVESNENLCFTRDEIAPIVEKYATLRTQRDELLAMLKIIRFGRGVDYVSLEKEIDTLIENTEQSNV